MASIAKKLTDLLGPLPSGDEAFSLKMRIHQGWWRMAVLGEEAGPRPKNSSETVCNTIKVDDDTHKNFVSENSWKAFEATVRNRDRQSTGIIEEDRARTNLLSSQPMCFNFFGELKAELGFAAEVLRNWIPDVARVLDVHFEYGLPADEAFDKSAFDVAFEFESDSGRGLLGLEVKYTDDFSPVATYQEASYQKLHARYAHAFSRSYEEYQVKRYNELFRNQLIAEWLIEHKRIDHAITGVFCHHEDNRTLAAASAFQSEMLKDGEKKFRIITYENFFDAIQKMDLTWERREWVMLLWARYCGLRLSEVVSRAVE